MSAKLHLFKLLNITTFIVLVAAYSTVTSAQNLGVSGNSVTISVPGTSFSQVATLDNLGAVSSVTGVPTTGTLTTPSFSFTLEETGAAGTSGTYAVGIVLDEQGSSRRLEVFIPGVVLTFDGSGNLTGTLSNPTVNIYGRDTLGATSVLVPVPSGGSVNFNGSTLSFSAASQIALIQAQGGILADITTSINNTGLTYDYTVILKNTAGQLYSFTHDVNGTPTAFPASGAAEFVIAGSAADAATLNGGQKLTGTVTFAAAAPPPGGGAPAPTECDDGFTLVDDECLAPSEQAEENLDDANAAVTALDADSTPEEITAAVEDLTDTGGEIADLLGDDNADNELGLAFINVARTGTARVALFGGDATLVISDLSSLLITIGRVAENLNPASLSAQQLTTLNSDTVDTIDSVTDLVAASGSLSEAAQESLTNSAESLLAGSVSANSGTLNTQNRTALVTLVDVLEPSFKPRLAVPAQIYTPLAGELGATLEAIEVEPDPVTNVIDFTLTRVLSISPGDISAPNADFSAIILDANAANTSFTNIESGVDFVADIASMAIVASSVAEGVFELPNGNILVVGDNISMTLSPASFDIDAFTDGVTAANAEIILLPNGGLSISDGVIVAVATFGADAGNSGSATFGGPTGADESDANYFFTVNYGNGVTQTLQPLINDDAFYDSVQGFGYAVSTDRASGIITIDSIGDFRPAYVVRPITFAEGFNHNLNKDASGVSYAVTDANSDGVMDAVVFTDSSVQIVFGMP